MPKPKLYHRPDRLDEKKLTVNGKRVAFRAKTAARYYSTAFRYMNFAVMR